MKSSTLLSLSILSSFVLGQSNAIALQLDKHEKVVQETTKSTVKVSADKKYGTGFLLESNVVVTNLHVINGARQVAITYEDIKGSFSCELLAVDEANDLALLELSSPAPPDRLPLPLKLKVPSKLKKQPVFYVGHPYNKDWTIHRTFVSNNLDTDSREFFQLGADSASGFSGAPVSDQNGNVLGVLFASEEGGVAMSYVIPAKAIRNMERFDKAVKFQGKKYLLKLPPELSGKKRSDQIVAPDNALRSEQRFILKLVGDESYATITEGDFFNVQNSGGASHPKTRFAEEFYFLAETGADFVRNGSVVKLIADFKGNGRRVIAGVDRENNAITRVYMEGKTKADSEEDLVDESDDPLRRLFVITTPNRSIGEYICYGDSIVFRCKYRDVQLRIEAVGRDRSTNIVHSHLVAATGRLNTKTSENPDRMELSVANFEILPLSSHPISAEAKRDARK